MLIKKIINSRIVVQCIPKHLQPVSQVTLCVTRHIQCHLSPVSSNHNKTHTVSQVTTSVTSHKHLDWL